MSSTKSILEAVGTAVEILGGSDWKERVDAVLEQLARAADVDRIYVFQNSKGEDGRLRTSQRCEWVAEGVIAQQGNPELQNASYHQWGFGRWVDLLSAGEPVLGIVDDLPEGERAALRAQDIVSILVVPMFVGTDWWGFIGFDDCRHERRWSGAEVSALKAVAQLFGAAVQHQRLEELQDQLRTLATRDELTSLLNRRAMRELLEHNHVRTQRSGNRYALALIDIDRFKIVNDAYGHAAGDQVLVRVAALFREGLRLGDEVARWGGEEFLCFLPETSRSAAVDAMERLRRQVAGLRVETGGGSVRTTISVGIADFVEGDESWESVLARADAALYSAKRDGRDRVEMADSSATRTRSIAGLLEFALGHDRLRPVFQPIVDLRTRTRVAEETLARIVDEDGALIEAAKFVETAGRIQLLHRVDAAMLRTTLDRCAGQVFSGRSVDHFVNVSADLLRHPLLVEELFQYAVQKCDVCGDRVSARKPIVIEITERELVGDVTRARDLLAPFLELGMRLAIDDFGSGYSSFHYLNSLDISYLKIDGDLIRAVASSDRSRAIVRSIQRTAGELGVQSVAECVEDEATADILAELGVDLAQGYYFGRPAIAEDLPATV
jgi:diguanylate cyclase (GGDEF)-like protein